MDSITCSIVLYKNKPEMLSALLQSLISCSVITKIFLVDNSKTNKLNILSTNDKIVYIFNNKNVGFGTGHNIAIKQAIILSNYHIVLNADIAFAPGTIEKILSYIKLHPDVGLLMPKIKYPNGKLQYACNLLPAPADLLARRFLPKIINKERMYRFEMRQSGYDKIIEVPYLSGCFMFLRVEAIKKAGLFDERFFLYPEDIDLTRRIHKYYKTIFFPYAEIIHVHERASRKSLKLLLVHLLEMAKYFNKWGWIFDKERIEINKKTISQFT